MKTNSFETIGSYAKKQLFGTNLFLLWSHRARFRFAVKLVHSIKPKYLLDYGCGDGTFLFLIGDRVSHRAGFDYDENQIEGCSQRFGSELSFYNGSSIESESLKKKFDTIFCMEVLEHCTVEQRFVIYKNINRMLADSGTVVFSVPVEIGPTLLFKFMVRCFLAIKNVEHYRYREKYSIRDFIKMFFAGKTTAIHRPTYQAKINENTTLDYHGHKGYNWRATEEELGNQFDIEKKNFTPLALLGGLLSSQVWFICSKKKEQV